MKKGIKRGLLIAAGALAAIYVLLLGLSFLVIPKNGAYSYAIYDRNGLLLGARVSSEEQWRFEKAPVPDRFKKCIILFEDKRFYFHPGVDFAALLRAAVSNKRAGRIVSGGSTITMQTARLLQKNKPRTYVQKIKEIFLAVLLEVRYTKKQILEIYSANAPFGGNVIGLEAASWRYFYRPPEELSWAESAVLAVLPNQPALVYPGANSTILKEKRDRVLEKLYAKNLINQEEYELSLLEKLPSRPYDLPGSCYHYLEYLKSQNKKSTRFYTSIDPEIQHSTARILEYWSDVFARKGINNASAIILDTKTKEVLAYCGNTSINDRNKTTGLVDLIQAKRSSGSLLKPFLYGAMLDSGQLLPEQLVADIPTRIGSYRPDNNVSKYCGVVPADEALSRSLNIPAVRELREYGINAFLDILHRSGFTTLNRTSDEYGLPLILGGGEITLYEAVRAYADLTNCANLLPCGKFPLSAGASWLTLQALAEGTRPDIEASWQSYGKSKKIAWKTGTSSGNRDAWAIGTTNEYTVGVWIGNAEGEGNAELKSSLTTAPVLFDIFSVLPQTSWVPLPVLELKNQTVCKKSGYAAGQYCQETDTVYMPVNAGLKKSCPYCKSVSLTPDGKYQASAEDLSSPFAGDYYGKMPLVKNYFVLPANLEYWYKKTNIGYVSLPEFVSWHKTAVEEDFVIVFPDPNANIFIPVEIDGQKGEIVLQAAAHLKDTTLYWDLDGDFLGFTTGRHELKACPKPGEHLLTVTSSDGTIKKCHFTVLSQAD